MAIYSGALQKHTQNSLTHNLNNQWELCVGFGSWEQSQLGWNFNKCVAVAFAVSVGNLAGSADTVGTAVEAPLGTGPPVSEVLQDHRERDSPCHRLVAGSLPVSVVCQ